MTASGVPPHIATVRDVLRLYSAVQDLPSRMMLNFGKMLDDRGVLVAARGARRHASWFIMR